MGTERGGIAWFGYLYGVLPVAMAISLPYIPAQRDFRRHALRLAGVVTVLMVALDVTAPSGFVIVGTNARTVGSEPSREVPDVSHFTLVSGIRTLVFHASRGFEGADEVPASFTADHPRHRVSAALFKLSTLAVPLGLALAISWGVQWIRREIPDRRSSVRAQFFTCWALGPGLYGLVFSWTERARTTVLFDGTSHFVILLPAVLLVVGSALLVRSTGGRSARRTVKVEV